MSVAPLHQGNAFHNDPKFGRLLLVSLIIHALIWAAFSGGWFGSGTRPKPPVYYVDLIHKPVLNPQAGRPEPRPVSKPKPEPAKSTAATVPPSVPKEPAKPEVKTPPKPAEVAIPKPEPKPVAKPTPKPVAKPAAKPVVQPERRIDQVMQSKIDEIRAKQDHEKEIDIIKQKLAELTKSTSAAIVPADVSVGMPDGQGNDVGVDVKNHIKEYIKQNWSLSPYLLEKSRIETIQAKVDVVYSASGELVGYPKIIESSGDKQFDDSIMRAIIKSKQLLHKLDNRVEVTIFFNLKEMAAARR